MPATPRPMPTLMALPVLRWEVEVEEGEAAEDDDDDDVLAARAAVDVTGTAALTAASDVRAVGVEDDEVVDVEVDVDVDVDVAMELVCINSSARGIMMSIPRAQGRNRVAIALGGEGRLGRREMLTSVMRSDQPSSSPDST